MKRYLFFAVIVATFFVLSCSSSDEKNASEQKESETSSQSDYTGETENDVDLDETASAKYAKPEKFPQKTAEMFKDIFIMDSDLTAENIKNLGPAFTELAEFGKKNSDMDPESEEGKKVMTEISAKYGFASADDLQLKMQKVYSGIMSLKLMENVEKTEKPGEIALGMAKSLLGQANFSAQDLKLIHDNWDDAVNSIEVIEEMSE